MPELLCSLGHVIDEVRQVCTRCGGQAVNKEPMDGENDVPTAPAGDESAENASAAEAQAAADAGAEGDVSTESEDTAEGEAESSVA